MENNFIQDVNQIIKRIENVKSDLIRIRDKYNTEIKENKDFWEISDIQTNWEIPDYDVYLLEKKKGE